MSDGANCSRGDERHEQAACRAGRETACLRLPVPYARGRDADAGGDRVAVARRALSVLGD